MQLSGNYLPIPIGNTGYSPNRDLVEYGRPSSERQLDTDQKNRQQTVEYVFKGELLEEVVNEQQQRNRYTQAI
ncbi:MAG: hypothetical protein H8D34_28680, partial [Chloroflexi bacterium]|nr:hypothetical protein [Chloroflexota bacterium]